MELHKQNIGGLFDLNAGYGCELISIETIRRVHHIFVDEDIIRPTEVVRQGLQGFCIDPSLEY